MVRLLLVTVCLAVLIFGCFADKEYTEHSHDHHGHHHAHDGHDHHDHESHKKLFAGDVGGSEDEQRAKLREIANKIDLDKNGQIYYDELRIYTEQRINEQRDREADELIATLDPDHTNKVTFDAYVKDTYGDFDMTKIDNVINADPRLRETRRTYLVDKQKWEFLDKDGDNSLTYDEFRQFLRPEDNDNLRRLEIDSVIKEYDEDKDGKISRSEYLKMTEAETGKADELGEELDKNNDGFGDFDEFAHYYLPQTSVAIDEETEHLLKECDTDKNGVCSPEDIVNAYSTFAGSQITDFGADLESAKEEL